MRAPDQRATSRAARWNGQAIASMAGISRSRSWAGMNRGTLRVLRCVAGTYRFTPSPAQIGVAEASGPASGLPISWAPVSGRHW